MIRWVIVAQLSLDAHTPTVYGTWETKAAAEERLERWERRVARVLGHTVAMSVEPMFGKTAAVFERDFEARTCMELPR